MYSSWPSNVCKRLVDHGVARTHGRPTAPLPDQTHNGLSVSKHHLGEPRDKIKNVGSPLSLLHPMEQTSSGRTSRLTADLLEQNELVLAFCSFTLFTENKTTRAHLLEKALSPQKKLKAQCLKAQQGMTSEDSNCIKRVNFPNTIYVRRK